ncbi:uncharacterized protein MONBRDRAFT_23653 [Monosiga brevicollis MX1]|uniref:Capsid protein n=1 Tax=Monosiga brevicollis TaxID=81824 RepID=A9UU29_MONBE|nr:uncharacterized protein MONBRDRAFT_23653 [Monosiga brevicollis MX1]EDQ91594.1 predicted protein [Monosiga brevicollis MX1]|eukprot:XP_001744016.1 hypothetical protein [Monosiga brevicollis MX1]
MIDYLVQPALVGLYVLGKDVLYDEYLPDNPHVLIDVATNMFAKLVSAVVTVEFLVPYTTPLATWIEPLFHGAINGAIKHQFIDTDSLNAISFVEQGFQQVQPTALRPTGRYMASDPKLNKDFDNRYDNADLQMDRRAKDIAAAYTEYDEMKAYKMYLETLETEARVRDPGDPTSVEMTEIKADGTVEKKTVKITELLPKRSEFEQARRAVIVKINKLNEADLKQMFAEFETESIWELSSKRPEHAVTAGSLRHVIHELQPKVAPPATFFNSVNQYIDVDLPKHIHYVNQTDLHLVLTNNDMAGDNFNSMPSNLFSRIDIRVGNEIKQTVTDLEQWMDAVIYKDPWEHERHQEAKVYDAANYAVDSTAVFGALSDSPTIRIPITSLLTQCGIPLATCDEQVTLRFYSQVASNVLNTGNIALKEFKFMLREIRGDDSALQQISKPNLDWRFLEPKHEEKTLSLTDGSTTTWVLNNFSPDDLCSHMWVFVRNTNLAGANRDTMLSDVIDRIWLEDESGHNLTNGIQWKAPELLAINYPDNFNNTASQSHGLYLVYCPATDPQADYREGVMSGAQPLVRNMKLRITAQATGNYNCTVVAMCYKHCRVQGGQLIVQ